MLFRVDIYGRKLAINLSELLACAISFFHMYNTYFFQKIAKNVNIKINLSCCHSNESSWDEESEKHSLKYKRIPRFQDMIHYLKKIGVFGIFWHIFPRISYVNDSKGILLPLKWKLLAWGIQKKHLKVLAYA